MEDDDDCRNEYDEEGKDTRLFRAETYDIDFYACNNANAHRLSGSYVVKWDLGLQPF